MPKLKINKMTNIIIAIREKFNIDQTQIARDCGLSRGYINKVENGKLEISVTNLQILKDVYGEIELNKTQTGQISKKLFTGYANTNQEKENQSVESDPTLNNKETNTEQLNTENKEAGVNLNETSVHSIIETNRNISRTLEKMVDTNIKFSELLKSIIPAKSETYQGVHQDTLTKLSQILEYVVEIGTGKRWKSKEDGFVELNKRFFGSSEVLKETDTHILKGK